MGLQKDAMGLGADYFTPKSINRTLMTTLFTGVDDSVKMYGKELLGRGWRFYVVDQTRGQCYYLHKVITIPSWVCTSRSLDERIWYISHEMAHAYAPKGAMHGDEFMAELIRICPERCIHYELGYKPRNAARNGIGQVGYMEELGF